MCACQTHGASNAAVATWFNVTIHAGSTPAKLRIDNTTPAKVTPDKTPIIVAYEFAPLRNSITKINNTPAKHDTNIRRSAAVTGSRNNTTPPTNTHAGQRYCSQIAFAAGPCTIADMNDQTITAKQIVIGTIGQRKQGRRIIGISTNIANPLRKNPNNNPRVSAGQASNQGDLANNPLVLHNTAAPRIHARPTIAS